MNTEAELTLLCEPPLPPPPFHTNSRTEDKEWNQHIPRFPSAPAILLVKCSHAYTHQYPVQPCINGASLTMSSQSTLAVTTRRPDDTFSFTYYHPIITIIIIKYTINYVFLFH